MTRCKCMRYFVQTKTKSMNLLGPLLDSFVEFNVCPEMETVCGLNFLIHDGHRFSKRFFKNGRNSKNQSQFKRKFLDHGY